MFKGSPLPAHLTPEGMRTKDLGASPVTAVYNSPMGAGNASVLEDQTCTNLLALLEPTVTTEHVDSPGEYLYIVTFFSAFNYKVFAMVLLC